MQLPAHFRTSSFCHDGGCVAVARADDGVEVASTLLPGREPIPFTAAEWAAFVAGVKNGEFDLDGAGFSRA